MSNIQWTDETWNPVAGCTRVSAGCDHCYAVPMTHRLGAMAKADRAAGRNPGKKAAYEGLTVLNNNGGRHFNGKVNCIESALVEPLTWKKPRRVFVNSMADLFHKEVPFEFIDRVFAVMALCPQHTFQVLTKRPDRMAAYFREGRDEDKKLTGARFRVCDAIVNHWPHYKGCPDKHRAWSVRSGAAWPLPNVWLGTSVENQQAADERIPHLLRCPAAVRFLSCEPLLGGVDLLGALARACDDHDWEEAHDWAGDCELCGGEGVRDYLDAPDEWGEDCPSEENHLIACRGCAEHKRDIVRRVARGAGLHWAIVGGESGPGARACDVAWIRSIVRQCDEAGVPCFVKQLGADPIRNPEIGGFAFGAITDPKGGDPSEWPENLRVRQMPGVTP